MTRVRVSTTVDEERLLACRARAAVPDSQLLDRALSALLDQLEAEAELAALERYPYDEDPELAWVGGAGPELPYDGAIPSDVLELAAQRRRERGG